MERERTEYAIKQLSEWWFDLSKIAAGSLLIPVFLGEYSVAQRVALFVFAVLATVGTANFGLKFAQKIENGNF